MNNYESETVSRSAKRKAVDNLVADNAQSSKSKKSRGSSKSKGKGKAVVEDERWPDYFKDLFKIFKALNTVLAFCSSRKHLAITFSVVRSSVEALLKHPLQLSKVAELKAILPDLLRFAYIPHDQMRVNDEGPGQASKSKSKSNQSSSSSLDEFIISDKSKYDEKEEDYVLILDFVNKIPGKKSEAPSQSYQLPPALSPTEVKKLIQRRNDRFIEAVEELLAITPQGEDVVELLQTAARDHVPIDPNSLKDNQVSKLREPQTVPNSSDRSSIDVILDELIRSDLYKEQIVSRRIFPPKEGRTGELSVPLSDAVMKALKDSRKITSFYTHQAVAIDAIRDGRHVIVSTSTASGKSAIYQAPLLGFLEEAPDSTAIFIYPTKALAQDQKGALEQLLWSCEGVSHLKVATYDGDTPKEARTGIRESAAVIFTNFDMLHMSILPYEEQWRHFFKNLKLVAVDELHYYTGVFGSHVAFILRRLRRICAAVGNRDIRFVSCSATIANPGRHMRDIFGVDDVVVVTDDGAPSGRKDFLIWNPPPIDPVDPKLGRRNSMIEATTLMRFLMKRGVRAILFCKIRKVCEQAMKMLRADLTAEGRLDILQRVKAYRGGYSQQDRRKIEHEAFSGNLLGIVATNALELGVDIGVLDAVIMLGYPFGIANLRQQAGRAGRRSRDALAVLVADSLPLDQYYVQNPDELFDKTVDEQFIDLNSTVILESHLQCAAFEMPLSATDSVYFGDAMQKLCESRLVKDKDDWYHTNPKYMPFPSQHVSIRGIQEETYCVVDVTKMDRPKLLEEIEVHRALFETYEGAVFIHQGETYIVHEVSHDSKTAKLIQTNVNWVTKPRDFTDVDAVQTWRIREIKGSPIQAFYGQVDLKTVIFGYFKLRNNTILDSVDLEMPPFERSTSGMWIDVPKAILDIFSEKDINAAEAIHGAEHAFLNRFPMQADVRTECKVPTKEYNTNESRRKRPARLIFYDSAGTQGAVAAKAFDHVSDILHSAFEAIESCGCSDGCTRCIRSPYCKENNLVTSKLGSQIILRGILGLPINKDAIPDQDTHGLPLTIVEAEPVRAGRDIEVEQYVDGPYDVL